MAQAFARLGTAVTLIDQAARVLPQEDADAAAIVARRLTADGVTMRLGATILEVSARRLWTSSGAGLQPCDQILIAAGRTPNIEALDLAAAGVAFDADGVVVDDHLRTSNRRIFAAGDVCSRVQVHPRRRRARAHRHPERAVLRARARERAGHPVVHLHRSRGRARRRVRAGETITIPLADVDRAVVDEERDGFVRVHHERGRLLGCTVVASRAGEMIGVATHALTHGASLGDLGSTIHPYPTLNNAFRAAATPTRRTRLTPGVRAAAAALFPSATPTLGRGSRRESDGC